MHNGEGKTYAVPEPVGGCGEGDTARANGKRENFADDDPCTWTPCGREEEDIDTDECDLSPYGCGVATIHGPGDGHNEFAHQHAQGAPDEEGATAEFLNGVE